MSVLPWLPPRWMVLGVALCLLACHSTTSESPPPASLFLQVQSPTGEPVPEARVRLSPDQQFKTDPLGQVRLTGLPAGQQFAVQVDAEGFVSTSMSFTVNEGVQAGARIESLPLGPPVKTFHTSQGAVLESQDVTIDVPPGALVDAQGRPIEGEVEAYLRVLDLDGDELRLAPGMQQGLLRPGQPPVGLESLGVMALVFKRKGPGSSSQAMGLRDVSAFARRIGIKGRVPGSIRASSIRRPQDSRLSAQAVDPRWQIPLWRWDASLATWVATGELGTFSDSNTLRTGSSVLGGSDNWVIQVSALEPILQMAMPYSWRSPGTVPGNPLQHTPEQASAGTTCLEVLVKEAGGKPVAGREVIATGVNYSGLSRGLTDDTGRVLLDVMLDRTVRVKVGDMFQETNTGTAAGRCQRQGNANVQSLVGLEPAVEPVSVTIEVAAPRCAPGETEACDYSGPRAKLGKGICRAGQSSCNPEGMDWGACVGEVLPQKEDCTTEQDDDCDGTINEGCASVCKAGTQVPCYGGPENTQDVGQCRAGIQTCVAGGTAWSACEGRVLPAPEDCSLPGDEDCDGMVCECQPGQIQQCSYRGPAGTEGVGMCRASTRTCEASSTGGKWGPCQDEVTPQAESCTLALDEDCDGQRNEACGWVAIPSMDTARDSLSAVVLRNGHVLVMGGFGSGGEVLKTARVYDPATTTWTGVGDMRVARKGFGAVLLNNGRVLAVGGWNISQLDTAEVYNPITETWTAIGNMAAARDMHTTTLLSDGRVLVTGGRNTSGATLDTAELHDPTSATHTWTATGTNMTSKRLMHAATLLDDGRVLVTGGHLDESPFPRLGSAEIYNPATNTWTAVSPMTHARTGHTSTRLSNGHVLVAGGAGNSEHVSDAEVYDPKANTWTTVGKLSATRDEHRAVLLSNGHVLVSGGDDGSTATIATTEEYDPDQKTWTAAAPLKEARTGHTLVLLGTGEVLVLGGRANPNSGALTTAEVYNPLPPAQQ